MNGTVRERFILRLVERLLTIEPIGGVLLDGDALVLPTEDGTSISLGKLARERAVSVVAGGKVLAQVLISEDAKSQKPMGLDSWAMSVFVLLFLSPDALPSEDDVPILPGVWATRITSDVYALYATDLLGQWAEEDGSDPLAYLSECDVMNAGVAEDFGGEGGVGGWITGHGFTVHYRHVTGDPTEAR